MQPEIDSTTGQIVGEIEQPAPKRTECWFRPLRDDRLEIYLVGTALNGEPVKVRASGAQEAIWELVEWFEQITGREVVGDWRRPPRIGPRPMAGQLSITEQLESPRSLYDVLSEEADAPA